MKKTALTIAGSDSSGGAGVQADIKTLEANGVYAMSVITALTVQNTCGVQDVLEVPPEFFRRQLESVLKDILPAAVKIGMLYTKEIVEETAVLLKKYDIRQIVVDPVMVSTSGRSLLREDAKEALQKQVFPLARVLTPNIPEAELLNGESIQSKEEVEAAARQIGETYGCGVVIKGGHALGSADDCLYDRGRILWFPGERIENPNNHGTGCTFSSAITAGLAKGLTLEESIRQAKEYMNGALRDGLDLGKGNGPLNHIWKEKGKRT